MRFSIHSGLVLFPYLRLLSRGSGAFSIVRRNPTVISRSTSSSAVCPAAPTDRMTTSWDLLRPQFRDVDPTKLVHGSPQMAKDENYARAVQMAWNNEELTDDCLPEHSQVTYNDANAPTEGTSLLYGHIVRRIDSGTNKDAKVPGILLFHTGAGPHDVSLLWKADALVSNKEVFPHGAIVFIADILSDDIGWGWSSDRTQYSAAREFVLEPRHGDGVRVHLQNRLQAALDALLAQPYVDRTNLAALGWCLGGHSILELGRMQQTGMQAMVTFHGVFDGVPPSSTKRSIGDADSDCRCRVLICNGEEDPFVSKQSLETTVATFVHHGIAAEVLSCKETKHGFTNPAQDFNPNPSFRYQEDSARKSWAAALHLLQTQLR